jgi:hypothetical protein
MPNGGMQASRDCLTDLLQPPVRPGGNRQAVADGGYGTMMALRGTGLSGSR